MTDPFNELKKAINVKAARALRLAAQEFNRLTDPFTPKGPTGFLEGSKREVVESDYAVSVVIGDSKTKAYAAKQYYTAQRHRGDFKSGLKDLTALYRDAGGGKRSTAKGGRYLYNRAYRLAVKNGQLNKLDAPMIYQRGAADPQIMQELKDTFYGAFENL